MSLPQTIKKYTYNNQLLSTTEMSKVHIAWNQLKNITANL